MSDIDTIASTGAAGDGDRLIEEGAAMPAPDQQGSGPDAEFFERSRLMVVALFLDGPSGVLKTRAQSAPDGPWEADWRPVPGADGIKTMAAGRTTDGRVAMAGLTQGDVLFIDEAGDGTGDADWNPPMSLGLPPGTVSQLAMGLDIQGLETIIAVDDGVSAVWAKRRNPPRIVEKSEQVTPPGSDTPIDVIVRVKEPADPPWTDWTQIGQGPLHVVAANAANGALALFGYENPGEGGVYGWMHQVVDPKTGAVSWSEYARFPGTFEKGSYPAVGVDTDGALNVFVTNGDRRVWQTWQEPAGSDTWSPWVRPGLPPRTVGAVAVGIDGHGHLVVAAKAYGAAGGGTDLYANYLQDAEHQVWRGWEAIATAVPPAGPVAMAYNADGRLTYFAHDGGSPGSILAIDQAAMDSTSWTAEWTLIGVGMREFAVVRDLTPPAES